MSPAQISTALSTTTNLFLEDSYGSAFPGQEGKKWVRFIGLPVRVHNADYSDSEEVTLTGFLDANPNVMTVSPAPALCLGPDTRWRLGVTSNGYRSKD